MTASKSVLVTGASSFVGAHLAAYFAGKGSAVTAALSQTESAYEPIRKKRIDFMKNAGVALRTLDVTDATQLKNAVGEIRPSLVLHHAGWVQKYGDMSYDLNRGHAVNVAPLEALYAALSETDCQGVVVTGSSAEYADQDTACTEDQSCAPTMPYGLSKLTETLRAKQLSAFTKVPTRVVRLFIPYGSLDTPQKLIPSVMDAIRRNTPIGLSPCEQKRDFLFIDDVLSGYEAAARDVKNGGFDIFNICSGVALPLKDLLSQMTAVMNADPALLKFGEKPMRAGEPPVSYGSADKAKKKLGWSPRPLKEGVERFFKSTEMELAL